MAYSGTCTHSYWSSWSSPFWGDSPVFHWLVILIGLSNSFSTSTFSETIKIKMCMYSSLASHSLHREEGSGHTAIIELSPQQKVDRRCKHQSPIHWFLVSHQVFYLQPIRAGSLFIADRYFTPKNSTNMMSGGSMLIIHCCRRSQTNAVQ